MQLQAHKMLQSLSGASDMKCRDRSYSECTRVSRANSFHRALFDFMVKVLSYIVSSNNRPCALSGEILI